MSEHIWTTFVMDYCIEKWQWEILEGATMFAKKQNKAQGTKTKLNNTFNSSPF